MITATQVKETRFYKTLDNVQGSIILKKNCLEKINLGVNMSNLKSYDFWVEKTSPRHKTKEIVKELLEIKNP
jgi:hypothetical protein